MQPKAAKWYNEVVQRRLRTNQPASPTNRKAPLIEAFLRG